MENQERKKAKGVVDIVFLIDVTGSMSPCIEALKENISLFIDNLTSTDANNSCIVQDWRSKIVGYRDFELDEVPFVDNPFVRDDVTLKMQLSSLVASGGGDEPESLLDALYKISTMDSTEKDAQEEDANKWRYRSSAARIVIVFTDASYKESMSIPEAAGGNVEDLMNQLTANRIILSLFAPDMECYDILSSVDKAEFEPIDPGDGLAKFTSDQENFKETLKALAKSVSKSSDVTAL